MAISTLYIDEAGDLGIGRGTDWFVLAGVLVNSSDEPEIRQCIRAIRSKLNIHEIHFRKMVSHDKKNYAVAELSKCNFEFISIIANTSMLNIADTERQLTEPASILSYNHMSRFLIERASWLLRDTGRTANIVLSSRGTSRDRDLIRYIENIIEDDESSIERRFENISAKTASEWDLLQLADVCATSIFNLYQKNGLGFITPCYAYRLRNHLYRHNGQLNKYGMKFYDEQMAPHQSYYQKNSICQLRA